MLQGKTNKGPYYVLVVTHKGFDNSYCFMTNSYFIVICEGFVGNDALNKRKRKFCTVKFIFFSLRIDMGMQLFR